MTDSDDKKTPALYGDPTLYDALYDGFTEDIAFYRELVPAGGGPVLELACGSGRVTVPLAETGVPVTGVDLSREMVRAARARAARAGAAARVPRFLVGDMRDPLPERAGDARYGPPFDLVIIPLHSLSHLLDAEDVRRCLRSVRAMLASDGALALAVHNPLPAFLDRDPEALYQVWIPGADRDGAPSCRVLESTRFDARSRVQHVRWWVEVESGAGEAPSSEASPGPTPLDFRLRLFSPRELDDFLTECGFAHVERWGWYDRSPFTGESGTQVILACPARPAGPAA